MCQENLRQENAISSIHSISFHFRDLFAKISASGIKSHGCMVSGVERFLRNVAIPLWASACCMPDFTHILRSASLLLICSP